MDVAGWPSPLRTPANNGASSPLPTAKTTPTAAIVADTVLLDPPEKLAEFSSHLLLWNSIRQELQTDPLAAGADAEAFLRSRMRQYGVDEASLDRRLFVGALIWPAVMQGLAQRLIAEGLPLKLYGKGWSDVAGLSPAAGGEVTSRPHLAEIASGLSAIVDARPATWRNGLYSLKRPDGHIIPVVRTAGRTFGVIRHDLSQALAGKWVPSAPTPGLDLWPVVQRLRERS